MVRRRQQTGVQRSAIGRASPRGVCSLESELGALLEVGDHRAVARRAAGVLADADASAADRAVAQAAQARVRPDPLLAAVSAACFLLLAAVALAGLGR